MLRSSRCAAGIVLLCLAATAACSRGTVTATTKVTIRGAVVDAAGAPIAGASVLLIAAAGAHSTATPTSAAGPLALACFLATSAGAPDQEPCARARQTTTDRTGSYSFTVNGAETQDSTGALTTFVAAPFLPARPGRPAEAGTSAAFQIQQPDVTVPALRSWGAPIATSTVSGPLVATWPSVPASDGADPASRLVFVDAAGETVWTAAGATSGLSVDPRVLEDRHGDFEVESTTAVQGSGTTFQVSHRTAPAGFAGPGAPPSRGAACTTGTPTATAQPCPVTTGDLASTESMPIGQAGLTVDLGSPRPIAFVVVRGTGGNLLVESSTDGTTWSSLGGIYSLPSTLTPTIPKPARYLRVRSASGTTVGQVTQISVWG